MKFVHVYALLLLSPINASIMAKTKTFKTDQDVTEFINSVADEKKRTDSFKLIDIMSGITGFKPYMWGPSIIGFGNYHYKYQSGHEGDAPLAGFSPRKNAITIYMASKFPERDELLKQLGKYKLTVACIYIKTLDDINISILKKMISASANKKALSQLKNRSITHNFFLHGGSSTFRLRRFAMIKS